MVPFEFLFVSAPIASGLLQPKAVLSRPHETPRRQPDAQPLLPAAEKFLTPTPCSFENSTSLGGVAHTRGCPEHTPFEPFTSCCSRHKLPACRYPPAISSPFPWLQKTSPSLLLPGHPLSSSHIQHAPFFIPTQPLLPLPPLPPYLSARGLPTLYSSFALTRGISSSSSSPKQLPSPCAIHLPCIFFPDQDPAFPTHARS